MKISLVHILTMIIVVITFQRCEIDDVKPLNSITEDNVITNESTAQSMLDGIYLKCRVFSTSMAGFAIEFLGDGLSNTGVRYGTQNMGVNYVTSSDEFIVNYYEEQYQLINQANWFISLVEQGRASGISEQRKNEMISEATCLRAIAHFNLLRLYGQFYDLNSDYGIVVRTIPGIKNEGSARSTVKDTYAAIIADLEFTAEHGPSGVAHSYVSRTTAIAMLAKVYLYMGDFPQAAAKSLEVINNTDGYSLEAKYPDVFTKKDDSRETFFTPFANEGENNFNLAEIRSTTYTKSLEQLADAAVPGAGSLAGNGSGYDPRFSYVYAANTSGPLRNGKFPFREYFSDPSQPIGNTFHVLRMAEIYLIYAEAKARQANGVDAEAVDRVNKIRKRAGSALLPIKPASKQELLIAIYREKMMELTGEYGEHWFDIVRYDRLGNQPAITVKQGIDNVNKLIMPIPLKARAGNSLLLQNPGYPD